MKIILLCFISICTVSIAYAEPQKEVLVTDTKVSPTGQNSSSDYYPRKYRTTNHILSNSRINGTGLEKLWASGSSQPTEEQLKHIVEDICSTQNLSPSQIIIVDLRQENHLSANGKSFTEFTPCFSGNAGKTVGQVLEGEGNLRDSLKKHSTLSLHNVKEKLDCKVLGRTQVIEEQANEILTEQEITERLGVGYVRFSVQDHFAPNAEAVDQFIKFFKTLPPATWLHFHCRGGKGRTSTFMLMYDMLKNHAYLAKEDFFKRHVALGGKDLDKSTKKTKSLKVAAENRRIFIHHFYDYVMAQDGYRQSNWSEWLKIHPLTVVQ